jgi:hypothetical protein
MRQTSAFYTLADGAMSHARFDYNFWMNETSGVLRPAVEAYLNFEALTDEQIAAMRAYLRQWINSGFVGPAAEELRRTVDGLKSRNALDRWLNRAFIAGLDPL